MSEKKILVDDMDGGIRVITLNRPEKRNAMDNELRGQLLAALRDADQQDSVRVSILRGAGRCFSSGYDLKSDLNENKPYFTPEVGRPWVRHITEGWLSIWELAKPIIAQVHGYAMAGGLELLGACDLVYASSDARLSHPVTQFSGLGDFNWFTSKLEPRHAMELYLTGREYSGEEAAAVGLVNQAFPPQELEQRVMEIAQKVASVPSAIRTIQKRFVYTSLEARGGRSLALTAADLSNGPHMQAIDKTSGDSIFETVKRK